MPLGFAILENGNAAIGDAMGQSVKFFDPKGKFLEVKTRLPGGFPQAIFACNNDVYYSAQKFNMADGKVSLTFYKMGEDKPKFDPYNMTLKLEDGRPTGLPSIYDADSPRINISINGIAIAGQAGQKEIKMYDFNTGKINTINLFDKFTSKKIKIIQEDKDKIMGFYKEILGAQAAMMNEKMFNWPEFKNFIGILTFVDENGRLWWNPQRSYAEETKGELWGDTRSKKRKRIL